jgi:hypothetical protein
MKNWIPLLKIPVCCDRICSEWRCSGKVASIQIAKVFEAGAKKYELEIGIGIEMYEV